VERREEIFSGLELDTNGMDNFACHAELVSASRDGRRYMQDNNITIKYLRSGRGGLYIKM
jgi:hypothetical protein